MWTLYIGSPKRYWMFSLDPKLLYLLLRVASIRSEYWWPSQLWLYWLLFWGVPWLFSRTLSHGQTTPTHPKKLNPVPNVFNVFPNRLLMAMEIPIHAGLTMVAHCSPMSLILYLDTYLKYNYIIKFYSLLICCFTTKHPSTLNTRSYLVSLYLCCIFCSKMCPLVC